MATNFDRNPGVNEAPNVNLVHLADGPGGIEVLLPLIIVNIPEYRFSAFVVRKSERSDSVYAHMDTPVYYGSNNNLISYAKIFWHAFRRRNEPFHVFNIGPIYLLLLRLAGVKKILYSLHGTIYWKNKKRKHLVRWLWKRALDPKIRMTANSAFSKSEFIRKISDAVSIDVIPNPIDSERFAPPEYRNENPSHYHVVYTGRLEKGKNLPAWIDIAVQVHKALPTTQFSLYGKGSLRRELEQKIIDFSAGEFIHLKGLHPRIEEAYRGADALLFISEYESFGNVVVESILCGTPVIVSPIPVMKEIFRNYPEFILTEEKDFASQVLEKLKDLPRLKQTALKAREEFSSRFSKDSHMRALRGYYARMINGIEGEELITNAGTANAL